MHCAAHRFGLALLAAALLAAAPLRADTIVLKNGRRISAGVVVEENGKVSYETSAGRLSLPLSIVDHIDRGASGPAPMLPLGISPPPVILGNPDLAGEITRSTVHDGAVDREFIAKLVAEARHGRPEAAEHAALAHHVAAQFALGRGDLERALADERTALSFAPEQLGLLLNVANLHLRRSEYRQSLEYLRRARRVAPDSPEVPKLAGWAWYGLNKLDEAVAEWQRSLALRRDPEVRAALDKALRDKAEEETYKENESAHFTLRYSGVAEPALAREVLRTLEAHFSAISSALDFSPPESIGVVLYTQEAFADITRAPGWAGALNDGRIRVPVQGLTSVSPELSRVLKHELTHSFLDQKTDHRCPTWLNEGLAQWMEGLRSAENAPELVRIYDAQQFAQLSALEGPWMRLKGDAAQYAYAWALANVEYLVQTDGMGDVTRILERIAAGSPVSPALREVIRGDYGDLMESTVAYLRTTYIR
ncbi:MAG: hypothetical protein LAN84_08640 [Acidobacteriia bacterium]|nr:hypothetical protein [Terriglobia bacterium]